MSKPPTIPNGLPPELQARVREILLTTDPSELSPPRRPQLAPFPPSMRSRQKVVAIQRYVASFEYNLTGTNYFELRKDRGLRRIGITAKDIMREALPIKCIEAVFLACFLTVEVKDVDRIPIAFKSTVNGLTFQHIVMAVRHRGLDRWGAIGISRRKELGSKDLVFKSLADLILDFKQSYEKCWHELLAVYVGFEFGRSLLSQVRAGV